MLVELQTTGNNVFAGDVQHSILFLNFPNFSMNLTVLDLLMLPPMGRARVAFARKVAAVYD